MHHITKTLLSTIIFCGFHVTAIPASAGSADTLEVECHKQLKLGDSGCTCIRERAEDTLNDKQQALVVAMVLRDHTEGANLRANMSNDEVNGAASFMSEAPQACATQ